MVETGHDQTANLLDDEPSLQAHLNELISSNLLTYAGLLLCYRKQTCERRVQDFPNLCRSLLQSSTADDFRDVVSTRKNLDAKYKDGGILDLEEHKYVEMRQSGTLESYLKALGKQLEREKLTAQHRNLHDRPVVDKKINQLAVMISQLTNRDPEHAIVPVCKLISDANSRAIIKCDLFNIHFEKFETPEFDFSKHSTVQVGQDLYATSFDTMQVTLIQNLLSKSKAVQTTALTSHYEKRLDHTACIYKDEAFFVIGGACGFWNSSPCNSTYRFDFKTSRF